MKRWLSFEIRKKSKTSKNKEQEKKSLRWFASQSEYYEFSFKRVKHKKNLSGNETSISDPDNKHVSGNPNTFFATILLIGSCFLFVGPLMNSIQWIATSQFAQCMGLNYSQDQIGLLNQQVFQLLMEALRFGLTICLAWLFKLLSH